MSGMFSSQGDWYFLDLYLSFSGVVDEAVQF